MTGNQLKTGEATLRTEHGEDLFWLSEAWTLPLLAAVFRLFPGSGWRRVVSCLQMPAWKVEVDEAEHEGIVVDNGWVRKKSLVRTGR